LYSVLKDNCVLFSSIFNTNFDKEIQLCSIAEEGELVYCSVFTNKFYRDKLEHRKQPSAMKVNRRGKGGSRGTPTPNGKARFDFEDEWVPADFKPDKFAKSIPEENIRKYDALLGRYLNTISHIEYNWLKLKNNEKNLNSAQKELSNIFHKYAKSVSKTSVLSKQKFFFTEEITFENLEPDSKKEVIFGEYTENHWLSQAPPGNPISHLPNRTGPDFQCPKTDPFYVWNHERDLCHKPTHQPQTSRRERQHSFPQRQPRDPKKNRHRLRPSLRHPYQG
jgi:hypothetical protein